MNYRALSEFELSEILDKSINAVCSGNEWKNVFPKVTGYKLFFPQSHGDLEEYPDSFRGGDHAIAHQSAKYPKLHPKIVKLIRLITVGNIIYNGVILANIFEHAGTHYAVELALFDKTHIKLYAEFIFTNDMYFERFQRFDFVSIIHKWGWCSETYYLLFAYMLIEGKYFHNDIKYLNFTGYSLQEKIKDNKEEEDKFLDSLSFFLKEIEYASENEELNTLMTDMFGKLVGKHIYSDNPVFPEEKERSEKLKERFSEVIEKLKNECSPSDVELSNEIEKDITLEEEDLPEI